MVKIFVCHYTPLVERRKALEEQFAKAGLKNIEWITEKDLAGLDLKSYYDGTWEEFERRQQTAFKRFNYGEFVPMIPGCIELNTQHILVYRRLIEQRLDSAVVFEDDVILDDDFVSKLESYIEELPVDWDMFYFGGGHSSALKSRMSIRDRISYWRGSKHVFRRENRQSRWTDSYMVSGKAAELMLPTIVPFQFPIDWELNYQQSIHQMNVYWAEPSISRQGSGRGFYASSLKK